MRLAEPPAPEHVRRARPVLLGEDETQGPLRDSERLGERRDVDGPGLRARRRSPRRAETIRPRSTRGLRDGRAEPESPRREADDRAERASRRAAGPPRREAPPAPPGRTRPRPPRGASRSSATPSGVRLHGARGDGGALRPASASAATVAGDGFGRRGEEPPVARLPGLQRDVRSRSPSVERPGVELVPVAGETAGTVSPARGRRRGPEAIRPAVTCGAPSTPCCRSTSPRRQA